MSFLAGVLLISAMLTLWTGFLSKVGPKGERFFFKDMMVAFGCMTGFFTGLLLMATIL